MYLIFTKLLSRHIYYCKSLYSHEYIERVEAVEVEKLHAFVRAFFGTHLHTLYNLPMIGVLGLMFKTYFEMTVQFG